MGTFNIGLFPSLNGLTLQASIMLTSAMAFLLFGYDQGVLGGLIVTPELLGGLGVKPTDSNMQGTLVAIYDIGCFIGSVICSIVGHKMGRRVFIALGSLLLIVGAAMQAAANGTGVLIAGRIISGVGMGFTTSVVPVWVAECSQPHIRGGLVTTQISVVIFGIVIAYVSKPFLCSTDSSDTFRSQKMFSVLWRTSHDSSNLFHKSDSFLQE